MHGYRQPLTGTYFGIQLQLLHKMTIVHGHEKELLKIIALHKHLYLVLPESVKHKFVDTVFLILMFKTKVQQSMSISVPQDTCIQTAWI